jgi:glucose/arabinose dehydrogenase
MMGRRLILAGIVALGAAEVGRAQFAIQGPGVNAGDFQITTFATGLNFPVSMTALADGSLLVATSNGGAFSSSTSGSLIRLADTDGDGVADVEQTLVNNVPGGRLTSVRRAGELIAVTGQGPTVPISFYRPGASPSDPLVPVGQFTLTYPAGSWSHMHTSLLLREAPGLPGEYELYFQLGSRTNNAATTQTVSLSGTPGFGATLAGDALHRVRLSFDGTSIAALQHTQIATGLRNASGLAFHPQTGDFYIGENGIDGLVNVNEPHSADELNVIAAASVGGAIEHFGFPGTYEEYRTGTTIGSTGILPFVAFQPIPMPNGEESEGVNEIAFAPAGFPAGLREGLFAGFHGRFSFGGTQNEENPVVFVDPATGDYFHFIANQQPGVGHLDGFQATYDTLYVSDMSPTGALGASQAGTGKIYAIRSLVAGDFNDDGVIDAADYVEWRKNGGTLEEYNAWRANFGRVIGGGGAVAARVPEPGSGVLPAVCALLCASRTRLRVAANRRVRGWQ